VFGSEDLIWTGALPRVEPDQSWPGTAYR
jgi:hypothetical protein